MIYRYKQYVYNNDLSEAENCYLHTEKHLSYCLCGEVKSESHDFDYIKFDSSAHTKKCNKCQYAKVENHVLKREGSCLLCGSL